MSSIREQGKLDDALEAQIMAADSKARLEDIYLPYKPKRRTKAQIAKEAGLEPLADALLTDPTKMPDAIAATFVDAEKGVADATAALEGARAILVERFAEDADLIGDLREEMWGRGRLAAKVDGRQEGTRRREIRRLFRQGRAAFENALASHSGDVPRREGGRARSEFRAGRPGAGARQRTEPLRGSASRANSTSPTGPPADKWLNDTVRWAWRTRIQGHLAVDMRMRLWQAAEEEAVRVFAGNLRDLLLAAPAGHARDDGPRSGHFAPA